MTPSSDKDAVDLVELLITARRSLRQIRALPDALLPPHATAAYAVQQQVADRLGWEPLGWKVAATTADMQAKLNSSSPIYGRSFRRFIEDSPARMKTSELLSPIVECEFFVTLGRDLPPRTSSYSVFDIQEAVANVHAGIEIAECRFHPNSLPGLNGIIADGSAAGRYVFGDSIPAWRDRLTEIEVVLLVDGVAKRTGSGADVLGHPINAACWLANQRRVWGDGLKAGEVISTGSVTGMVAARAGCTYRAIFDEQINVDVEFI